MWVYWFQSITIGLFNFVRILQLKEFSTDGFEINGQPVQPTQHTKIFTAFFFLFHYGFFHFIYLVFFLPGTFGESIGGSTASIDVKFIFLAALLFFVNHLFSFVYNRTRDTREQSIGTLMFYPYTRIVPMHVTIILGLPFGRVALPFFLVLKMFSDAVMHVVEHGIIRNGEKPQSVNV